MNLLNKTKFLVIGPMQYYNGRAIREYFKQELGKLNITVFDHYNKPFIYSQNEEEELGEKLKKWMATEQYDQVSKLRNIRLEDLRLIDLCDAVIFHYIPGVITCGSWEEFFLANRQKKVIFFITEGGKKLTPIWTLFTIPHKYIYNSKEDVVEMIKKIDSGEVPIDSERWRLLQQCFR